MSERLKSLTRVLKVQDQLKRSADWRLAEAERVAAEAAAAVADLNQFVERTTPIGDLARAADRQMRRLDERATAADGGADAARTAMRDATARQKLIGRAVEALAKEEAAARERKALERLVEVLAGRAPSTEHGEEPS